MRPLPAMFGNPTEISILFGAFVLLTIFPVVCFWFILRKAGFPPAWSLAGFLPGAPLIIVAFLAFAPWPASSADGVYRKSVATGS